MLISIISFLILKQTNKQILGEIQHEMIQFHLLFDRKDILVSITVHIISEETCQDICDKCAIQRLVNAMKKYPTKETIQEYGCWCICNVIAHGKWICLCIYL